MANRKRAQAGSASSYEIVIAAYPGVTLGREIEMVKAGLLYGDTVRLISPAAMYFLAADAVTDMDPLAIALLLDDFGALSPPIPTATRAQMQEVIRPRNISTKTLQENRRIRAMLRESLGDMDQSKQGLVEALNRFRVDEIRPAIRAGLVSIEEPEGFSRRDALGQMVTNNLEVSMDVYIGQLSELIARPTTHTMIDTELAQVINPLAAILEHLGLAPILIFINR